MLLKQAVGSTLRERRTALRMTLAEVAAAANVSLQYLSELERGRKEASSEVLDAITAALRIRPSAVMIDVATRLEESSVEELTVIETVHEVVELPMGRETLLAA